MLTCTWGARETALYPTSEFQEVASLGRRDQVKGHLRHGLAGDEADARGCAGGANGARFRATGSPPSRPPKPPPAVLPLPLVPRLPTPVQDWFSLSAAGCKCAGNVQQPRPAGSLS